MHLLVTASLDVLTDVIACLSENGFGDLIGVDDASSTQHVGAPVITPAAASASAAANIDLDATGLPWDERIHASTKTKKADGSWTRRRGVQDSEFIAVEAELRAKFPTTPTAGTPSADTALPVVAASPVVEAAPQPVAVPAAIGSQPDMAAITPPLQPQAVPVAAPQPVAAPVVTAPTPAAAPQPSGPPTTLHELLQHLNLLMDPAQGGKITAEYLNGVLGQVNSAWAGHLGGKTLASLADIAAFPTLEIVPWIWQVFQRDGMVGA